MTSLVLKRGSQVKAKTRTRTECSYTKNKGFCMMNRRRMILCWLFRRLTRGLFFLKFATDRICIDFTHGTNAHDFQLTSIFVVDQMEQGFPGAFCLSTRVNHNIMKAFISAIKNVCGGQQCQTFMTDDAAV